MDVDLDRAALPAGATQRVAILGGGMAGLAAAWRLSEPGWQERFSSITVYQRGARLGGKGASSRGENGRIEEHGLHVWLGYYDNAFRLMQDCYAELDRPETDPECPIRTWGDAFLPSGDVGMLDLHEGTWRPWHGHFEGNDLVPGEPGGPLDDNDLVGLVRRVGQLLRTFAESFDAEPVLLELSASPQPGRRAVASTGAAAVLAAGLAIEGIDLGRGTMTAGEQAEVAGALEGAMAAARAALDEAADAGDETRREWHLVGVLGALGRGLVTERVLEDPLGFAVLDDEDFGAWLRRHGAPEASLRSTFVRGLYDLVFGHVDGDPEREAIGAGIGCFLSAKILLGYKGSIFWKMAAGMGDIVFAPILQVLRARGVVVEFFHRVEGLHLDDERRRVERITMGRQTALRAGRAEYDPLVRVGGLPCFPVDLDLEQLDAAPDIADQPLEAAWCTWPDAERRVLQHGTDFDVVIFAMPPPMARIVATELVAARPEWRAMVDGLATVATQAVQLWLREDDRQLGWARPGSTITGFVDGFDTWASMPHLLDVETWAGHERPGTVAYLCNSFAAEPLRGDWAAHAAREQERVLATARRYCEEDIGHLLPGSNGPGGFRWDLLCGAEPGAGPEALRTQYWRANVDPSDRYVQSLPGTNRLRLRSDESGFDNLFLAGDWTDNGCNAGCIEAAVLSGLQAANAILGRHRWHRILGAWMP